MQKIVLEIEVDDATAAAFYEASPEDRERLYKRAERFMQRSVITPEEAGKAFRQLTEQLGSYAASQGWTDDLDEALLRGAFDHE